MSKFHATNGWFFERTGNGSVHVEVLDDPTKPDGHFTWNTFDEGIWASIVAFASARGETADTWREALAFHNSLSALPQPETRQVKIFIDGLQYTQEPREVTASDIRHIPHPPLKPTDEPIEGGSS